MASVFKFGLSGIVRLRFDKILGPALVMEIPLQSVPRLQGSASGALYSKPVYTTCIPTVLFFVSSAFLKMGLEALGPLRT